ncbi:MAG: phage capsid protein [Vulcanococcus sp.]
MAAPNFDASRLGLVNNTGVATDALFLKVFAGEVLTAFRKATVFEALHTVRTISSGKSAQFPIIGLASTGYHTPGTMLTGSQIKHAEAVVNIDDKLVSQVFLADIDEAKNHYDVRSQYSVEMGNALAYRFDQNVAAMIAKAARTATNFNTDLPGGTQINITAASKAAITGAQLATTLFSAAQKMDENNLPQDGRYCVLPPAQYYKLVQTTDVINRDWGGQGAYANGTVLRVAGIDIVMSNHLPTTNRSAVTGENNSYDANFTNSVGLIFNKQAVGTVKLMDLKMEQTGSDVHALWQGTFMVGSMALGTNVLRPDCAIEITTSV